MKRFFSLLLAGVLLMPFVGTAFAASLNTYVSDEAQASFSYPKAWGKVKYVLKMFNKMEDQKEEAFYYDITLPKAGFRARLLTSDYSVFSESETAEYRNIFSPKVEKFTKLAELCPVEKKVSDEWVIWRTGVVQWACEKITVAGQSTFLLYEYVDVEQYGGPIFRVRTFVPFVNEAPGYAGVEFSLNLKGTRQKLKPFKYDQADDFNTSVLQMKAAKTDALAKKYFSALMDGTYKGLPASDMKNLKAFKELLKSWKEL